MTVDVETVVIGAGVVGLAIARALALGGHEVLVLERHGQVGSEVSSRSSEVVHAGLYYPPASLKARFCVKGKELIYRFAAENGVPCRRYGKLLVATSEGEIEVLRRIQATAERNGVGDLVYLDAAEARALEPELACVGAYLSPSTGVIDSHAFMLALEGHLQGAGGSIVLSTPVSRDPQGRRRRFRACDRGRRAAAHLAQPRPCRRSRWELPSAGRSVRPETIECPKHIRPRATTSCSRASRRSAISSIPCRRVRGSAFT